MGVLVGMSARSRWFSLHGCTYDLRVEFGQTGLPVVIKNQHGVDHIVSSIIV